MSWIAFLTLCACTEEPSEKPEPIEVVEPSAEPCATTVYYLDTDGDGFGNPMQAMESCEPLEGYVQNNMDCNDENADEFPEQEWYLDADGDGFGSALDTLIQCAHPTAYVLNSDDCDDLDGSRNPESVWYTDSDVDGFGDALSEVESCSDVSTAVSNSGDCDDTIAEIHPNASEVCDFIDNDCDGLVDNEDPNLNEYGEVALYTDADGDGFGIDEYVAHGCPSSPLGSPITGDCDDGNADIFPGQFEWPDSVDGNCDDEPFFQSADYFSQGYTYDAERQVENPLLYEDLDGDGVSDFIFGDTTDNGDTGKVFWVSGTQTADFSVLDSSAFMWTGAGEDDEFGKSILVVEDLTNDGVAELIVGAPGAGTVYLFDGSTSGNTTDALWSWTIPTTGSSKLGRVLSDVGDIDGDGSTEFLVTDTLYDETTNNQGAMFLLSTSDVGVQNNPEDAVYVVGQGNNDRFGREVQNVDDVDGDGIVDVIVSAHKFGNNIGKTYVISLTDMTSGLVDIDTAVSFEGEYNQQSGTVLSSVGDFNGDGYKDFVIRAGSIWGSTTELGTLFLIHGKSNFVQSNSLADAEVQIDSTTTANEFGTQVFSPGDLNADGYDDLVFANPLSEYPLSANLNNHGMVFGVYGGTYTGTFTTLEAADFALIGPDNWNNFGTNLLSAGDVDTDGVPDFWISGRYGLYLFNGSTLSPQ